MVSNDRGTPLSDKQVLNIIHKRGGYRRLAVQAELMSDETFIERFRELVPRDIGFVDAQTAGKIYALRQEWEARPPDKSGNRPNYSDNTVRLQVNAKTLQPMSEEEQAAIFGVRKQRVHWFRLADILRHPLGLWQMGEDGHKYIDRGGKRVNRSGGRPSSAKKNKKKKVDPHIAPADISHNVSEAVLTDEQGHALKSVAISWDPPRPDDQGMVQIAPEAEVPTAYQLLVMKKRENTAVNAAHKAGKDVMEA